MQSIIQQKSIQSLFSNLLSVKFLKFHLVLLQYIRIVKPLIHPLWALEVSHATASDVFVFFAVCTAALKELFKQDPKTTGIPRTLANTIVDKFNDRYDELFANDIYICAFALNPCRLFLCYVMHHNHLIFALIRLSYCRLPSHSTHCKS